MPGSFLEDCPLSLRTSATTHGSMGMVVRECTGKEPTSWRPKSTETSLGNGCFLAVKVIGSMLGKVWKLSKTLPLFFYFRPSNLFHMLLNPVPRRAQSPEPGRGAQVFGGSPGTAWAGGARIVAGRLLSSSRGDGQGSRLFSSRRRTRRVPRRRRQQQAPRRRNAGGGGGGGGGVCARLAFPPPRQGERGGGEGRAEPGISQLGPQGPKRGTRCALPPHSAV